MQIMRGMARSPVPAVVVCAAVVAVWTNNKFQNHVFNPFHSARTFVAGLIEKRYDLSG